MKPIAIGTLVDYHGSHKHGRYVVTAHHDPATLFTAPEMEVIARTTPGDLTDLAHAIREHYPDGVAYEIFPEGMPRKFGLIRTYSVYRVRRSSLTVALCTREGFEPMEPFKDDV